MSELNIKNIKLGDNADTSKNFVIRVPAVADGTLVIERENGTDIITINSTGKVSISGTSTNDNATPGQVGEFLTATSGSAAALTSAVGTNMTAVTLTPGDWEVWGSVELSGTSATVSRFCVDVNTTSTAQNPYSTAQQYTGTFSSGASGSWSLPTLRRRFSVSTNTTIYLTAMCYFGAGTLSASGTMFARRMR